MKRNGALMLVALAMVTVVTATISWIGGGRAAPEAGRPVQELEWTATGGWAQWGQTTAGIFGRPAREDSLEIWQWEGATLRRHAAAVPRVVDVVVLPDASYLARRCPGDRFTPWPLVLATLGPDPETIETWPQPPGWQYRHSGISSNGQFVGLVLDEDMRAPPDGYRWDREQMRVGLLDVSELRLELVADFSGRGKAPIRRIAVSDDGRYVAIIGWRNGVAMVDTRLGELLWEDRPDAAVSLGYGAFAADGSVLYAADAGGDRIYVLDTLTGAVTREWRPAGRRRVTCFAVSPDGRWLAAGTGPAGDVLLVNTSDPDNRPIVLPHGRSSVLIVSFAPDSRHLASFEGSVIKIWKLPEPAGGVVSGAGAGAADGHDPPSD